MRTTLLIGICLSACWVRGPERNGLDGELEFEPHFADTVALGATNHILVARTDGHRVCTEGKNGEYCPSSDRVAIAIDAAACGDGCTATVTADANGNPVVDVVSTVTDVTLAVTVHALDGSDTWSDRFTLHFVPAVELRVFAADVQPVGAAYATEPDARTVVYVSPWSRDGAYLSGTYDVTATGDGVVEAAPALGPDYDTTHTYTSVHLASAGTGNLHLHALGLDRTIAFRAADPTTWTAVEFVEARLDNTYHDIADRNFLGATISTLRVTRESPIGGYAIAATAVLADGGRVLVSTAHVACTPADRVALTGWSNTIGAWFGLLDATDWQALSPGDATCTVLGHAELGSLAVHVE